MHHKELIYFLRNFRVKICNAGISNKKQQYNCHTLKLIGNIFVNLKSSLCVLNYANFGNC